MIDRAIVAHGRPHPQRYTKANREHQRRQAERQADRQALPDEFRNREIAIAERRSKIAMDETFEVAEVLHVHRLIEAVGCFQVGADLWWRRLLAVERAPGRNTHDEEGQRDDYEERGDGTQEAANRITPHRRQ